MAEARAGLEVKIPKHRILRYAQDDKNLRKESGDTVHAMGGHAVALFRATGRQASYGLDGGLAEVGG